MTAAWEKLPQGRRRRCHECAAMWCRPQPAEDSAPTGVFVRPFRSPSQPFSDWQNTKSQLAGWKNGLSKSIQSPLSIPSVRVLVSLDLRISIASGFFNFLAKYINFIGNKSNKKT